jgi:SPP1 family phage portal protein
VAYYADDGSPAFSCHLRKDENGKDFYFVYTPSQYFRIEDNVIVESGINGNGAIPVVEYPNNLRRLSDIEITITMTDEINKFASDRVNGVESFVASWIKFVNCEIDPDQFRQMRMEGALVVKSNNRTENSKADVDVISSELNQSQTQVAVNDQYEKLLVIQGIANRQENTGGDTQGAVIYRNGHLDAEKRAELSEPIFKRSERMALRIILNRLRIDEGFTLMPSDVEIKISRTKQDNMQTKAQVLQMLLTAGIKYERAIKTVGLFSDPEQVAMESAKRMDILYPETEQAVPNERVEVDEVVE